MYLLIKLSHRNDNLIGKADAAIAELETVRGEPMGELEFEKAFRFVGKDKLVITSTVKSIYVPDTDRDKLIIPPTFDVSQNISIPKFKEDDVVFATLNSVYLLRKESPDSPLLVAGE